MKHAHAHQPQPRSFRARHDTGICQSCHFSFSSSNEQASPVLGSRPTHRQYLLQRTNLAGGPAGGLQPRPSSGGKVRRVGDVETRHIRTGPRFGGCDPFSPDRFFGSLALFYGLDPRCGAPGDSGGCEMSAGVIAFVAVIPGVLIGIGSGVYFGRPRLQSSSPQKLGVMQRGTDAPTAKDDSRPGSGGWPEAVIDGVKRWAAGASEVKRIWLAGAGNVKLPIRY